MLCLEKGNDLTVHAACRLCTCLLFQAWVSGCPLLGDKTYDGGGLAIQLRENGFYLCSNRVSLEHPFYNAPPGKSEWAVVRATMLEEKGGGNVSIAEDEDGTVWIHCKVELPAKFRDFCASTKTS